MKKQWLICVVLLCGSLAAQGEGLLSSIWGKYADHPDFTVVNITPKMFKMMAALTANGKDAAELSAALNNLERLQVYTTEKEGAIHFSEVLKQVRQARSGFEELMSVREKGQQVFIFAKEAKSVISELILLVSEGKNFTLVCLKGDIDLEQVSRLTGVVRVDELEHLEKINNKNKK